MIALLLLLLLAAGLGLWGLPQGYPDFYGHVDEVGVAASIWNLFRAGTLEPTEFTYPAFYQYLVAGGIWLSALLGLPSLPSGGSLVERIVFLSYSDPGWSALVGRVLSAAAATGAVAVVHATGRRVGGRCLALSAAGFAAVAVVPVRHAHQALPDSTAYLLGAAILWQAWRLYELGRWRDYLIAGGLTGLLLATKYNGALCALFVVAAHALRRPVGAGLIAAARRVFGGWRLWAAGIAAVITAVAASPYLVLAWDRYLGVANYQVSALDFTLRETSPWWWIPRALVLEEAVIGGLMLAGLGLAVVRRQAFDVVVLAALLPAMAYIGSWTREGPHYLLPYYPALLLLGGRAFEALVRRLTRDRRLWVLIGLAVAAPSLWVSGRQTHDLTRPDTRALAADWLAAHVPPGSTLAMTWLPYCPRVDRVADRVGLLAFYEARPEWQARLRRAWAAKPAYRVINLEVWLSRPVVPEALADSVDVTDPETRRVFSRGWRTVDRLLADGATHLVLPDAVFRRYLDAAEADAGPDEGTVLSPAARFRLGLNRAYFLGLLQDPRIEPRVTVPSPDRPARGGPARGSPISIYRIRRPAGS